MVPTQLGSAGWLLLLAAIVFGLTRLLKADMLNSLLAKFGIPPIPAKAIPWVAIVLGFFGGVVQAKSSGNTWGDSALMGLWGILSGTLAIGGHEALEAPVRATLGQKVGNVLFGKRALPMVPPAERPKSNPPSPPAVGLSTLTLSTLLLLAGLLVTLPGCGLISPAVPVIETVDNIALEGEQVLSAVEADAQAYFAVHPDLAKLQQVLKDFSDAHLALDTLVRVGKIAVDLNDANIMSAIADFQAAWTDLKGILQQLGVMAPDGTVAATPMRKAHRIPEPLILTLSKKKS